MVSDGEFVAIFNSIHRVMKAEKILKEKRLPILLIPAPRTLHADCGLAIRYSPDDRLVVEELLSVEKLTPDKIYVKSGQGYQEV